MGWHLRWRNVWTIFRREARDQLRDRRTLFTVFVLPLLLYPILGIGILQLSASFDQKPRTVVVLGSEHLPTSPRLLNSTGDGFEPSLFAREKDAEPAQSRARRRRTGTGSNRGRSAKESGAAWPTRSSPSRPTWRSRSRRSARSSCRFSTTAPTSQARLPISASARSLNNGATRSSGHAWSTIRSRLDIPSPSRSRPRTSRPRARSAAASGGGSSPSSS